MHISDLFSEELLKEHIDNGIVNVQEHPDGGLFIYNYSKICHTWDEVTRACRGLIADAEGKIIARPFAKFFNYGDTDNYDEVITPDTPVTAYDKLDGSLGIVYPAPDGSVAVATRGSFTSPQAIHATSLIQNLLVPHFEHITILVEIIYPENQIVLDYQGIDDLFLLGGIDDRSGLFLSALDVITEIRGVYPDGGFNYMVQDYREIKTVKDALENLNRNNREGFVLHTDEGTMVKVRQEDYVAMHRLVFQISKRTAWYAFAFDMVTSTGKPFEEVATKGLKSHREEIESTGGTKTYTNLLLDRIPVRLYEALDSQIATFRSAAKEKIGSFISLLEEFDPEGIERKVVFAHFDEKAGAKFSGILTDIALSEDDSQRERWFDRLVLTVVESLKPMKGERLTDEMNEEDE